MASMAKRSANIPTEIPEALLYAIAFLLPGLNQVAQECGISIGEWIIMWHLSKVGVQNSEGQSTMLRQDLTDLLSKRGFGDANVTRLLISLEDKELIRRISLSQRERDELFGAAEGGNRLAVILQASGSKKIDEFKQRLSAQVERWHSEQSIMAQKALDSANGVVLQFTQWFFKGTGVSKPQ
jgi:DNA-binding MarR family transcriptional regulator